MSATPSAADREGTLALWHARHSGAIRVTPALGAVLQALAALSLILWRPTVSEDRGASRAPERLLFVRQPLACGSAWANFPYEALRRSLEYSS